MASGYYIEQHRQRILPSPQKVLLDNAGLEVQNNVENSDDENRHPCFVPDKRIVFHH